MFSVKKSVLHLYTCTSQIQNLINIHQWSPLSDNVYLAAPFRYVNRRFKPLSRPEKHPVKVGAVHIKVTANALFIFVPNVKTLQYFPVTFLFETVEQIVDLLAHFGPGSMSERIGGFVGD